MAFFEVENTIPRQNQAAEKDRSLRPKIRAMAKREGDTLEGPEAKAQRLGRFSDVKLLLALC